jgi:hypothetical protein
LHYLKLLMFISLFTVHNVGPKVLVTTVAPTSKVFISAMLLFLFVGNYKMWSRGVGFVKIDTLIEKVK